MKTNLSDLEVIPRPSLPPNFLSVQMPFAMLSAEHRKGFLPALLPFLFGRLPSWEGGTPYRVPFPRIPSPYSFYEQMNEK